MDETGAQLPSPSLPNITARRLYDAWFRRAVALDPALSPAQVEAALAQLEQWTDAVPDSASDAYNWEVERAADKRVIKPDMLAADARAAQVLERRAGGGGAAPATPAAAVAGPGTAPLDPTIGGGSGPAAFVVSPTGGTAGLPPAAMPGASASVIGATPLAPRYKLFVGGAQRGPYAQDEVVQLLLRGEIGLDTRVWNMGWNPRQDKWKTVGEMPELAGALDAAIPDPDDEIPDPE